MTLGKVTIGADQIVRLGDLHRVAVSGVEVELDAHSLQKIEQCNHFFSEKVKSRLPIYGLNTQFGDQVNLWDKHLRDFGSEAYDQSVRNRQSNLVRSHNCGIGDSLALDVIRGAMLLRAHCVSQGFSAVRPSVIKAYLTFLNKNIVPQCFRYGSIGASGDLIPLATLSAAVVGENVSVWFEGTLRPAPDVLRELDIPPLNLEGREGLALINGTSLMSSVAGLALVELHRIYREMICVIGMALEALQIFDSGYASVVHELKRHQGEIEVASLLRAFWEGSSLIQSLEGVRAQGASNGSWDGAVQDYYSLRSVAQGFGPFHENLQRVTTWVENEMNSVNDNPITVSDGETGSIYHTANFMGYYVTSGCDLLKMDISQAATWLHAVLSVLVHPRKSRGLPANLVSEPETYSGFRPIQILAASVAVECRKLAQSHASFMLPTEGDNQDVNSLGTHSAMDLRESVEHLESLVGILMMSAVQALELRGLEKAGGRSRRIARAFREKVPFLQEDRLIREDIKNSIRFLRESLSVFDT